MDDDFDPALELDLPQHADSLGGIDDFEHAPPIGGKRSLSVSTGQASNTLAFELAAAMDPFQANSLLDELGIEDDADDVASEREAGTETADTSTSTELSSIPTSPPRSRDPLHRSTGVETEPDLEHELDEAFSRASASLADSLRSTDAFLGRLRVVCDEAPLSDSRSSLPSLATTARLERLCATLVQTVVALARQREAQVRELREANKALAMLTPAQLGELEPLERTSRSFGPAPLGSGLDIVREEVDVVSEEEPTTPLTPRFGNAGPLPPRRIGTTAASQQSLAGLKSSTVSLLSTLSTINEATQVHRAAHADAARRLKSMRAVLANWRNDVDDMDRARAFIDGYERTHVGSGRPLGELARRETVEVAARLERAEDQARDLLADAAL